MGTRAGRSWSVMLIAALSIVLSGLPVTSRIAAAVDQCAAPANDIVRENCLPGAPASEWDVSGAGDSSIQGFATQFSVNVGATVRFKVDTDAAAYAIDIYRVGYYGGSGARHVATVSPSATLPQTQPACVNDSATGLVDCGNWAESAAWPVPSDAVSGVYFARLTRTDTGGASHIPFVVRNDASHSDLLFQTSDTTWQAYNSYGGNSLYVGGPGTNPGRAYKVSYNRPFTTRGTSPEDFFFNSEYPMIRWLEANGYDVSFISGIDTDRAPATMLEQHKVFMSVGHDEYWSGNQRANVEAARDAGVDLAFFSGNQIFWKTRWEPSNDGTASPYRTLVSYKETHSGAKIDPDPAWTGTWRDSFGAAYDAGRPENALAGTIFMVNCCTSAIQVPASDEQLRLWRNTRLSTLEGVTATLASNSLGYEWNADLDNGSRPAGQIDLSSTTLNEPQVLQDAGSTYAPGTATHSVTMHRAPSGALVFDAGTVQWSWGLDGTHDRGSSTSDSAMKQATVNLFADMAVQPGSLQAGLTAATASTDASAPTSSVTSPNAGDSLIVGSPATITGTASDTGGGRVAGIEVTTDNGTTWHPATGHETWSYSFTPETTGSLTIRSRATDDSVNTGPSSTAVTVTVAPHGCPCSIWDNSPVPTRLGLNDDNGTIDYGVKFRSDVDGDVTGFRFYKSPGETGTHTGHLWDTNGTLLASATFTGESASGWQQVTLASPIPITANTTYISSIFSSAGFYPADNFYFASNGVDNSPLHALAAGVDGDNAVYHEGSTDAFPDQSFRSTNYWADVVFSNGADTTPPVITSRSPAPNATGVLATGPVTATFNEPMNASTISTSTFQLRDASSAPVPGSVTYDAASRKATLIPSAALDPSSTYTALVTTGATDVAGNSLANGVSWSFTIAAPPPDDGPGGPILVIGSTANPFGRYYGEILRTEGLNEFRVTDISNVTAGVLSSYDVVILGQMSLTPAQATMLSTWASGGGQLVAMRPDSDLAGLLGLTSAGGSISNAYVRVDTSAPPGQGITNQTIQYHGTADDYRLSGATTLATLYSNATTATTFPALTLHAVGSNGGQAAAFTYDLARSVVYTRQGNPAWSGQERDGQPPIRSDDLFFGASASDPQPDWVDLNKVAIPQADEQQRLLANLVLQMEKARMPLPRFWYLPRGKKAVVVMTGDDHANGGT
ncbi:MAG: large repetitive protein, partial [Actinomycetota bacterium]|nr:large repetitive protein [Actinomycetota bacterium]